MPDKGNFYSIGFFLPVYSAPQLCIPGVNPHFPESTCTYFSACAHLIPLGSKITGLRSVKEKIITYDKIMRFCILRASKGLELFHSPLHAMFLGSPGTGKTTVARLMGKMLKKAGFLSSGHVVMKERSTLIGQYYSSEAEKALKAIQQAQGGILFIDEAHSLFQANDPKDPGKFVIEALMTALDDPDKDDWMLILADRESLKEILPSDIPMSTPKAVQRRKPVGFTFSSAS